MATTNPWPLIHAEREALAADLATLTGEQWATRSLCADWTVRDVLGGAKQRIAGLTLRSADTDWSTGSGPEVAGPQLSLVLAMTGRSAALADLSGDGLDTLRSRM